MNIDMVIHNKEIQLNISELEIEIQTDSEGAIENITVDGQELSEVESMVVRDNMREIQEEICLRYREHEKYKGNEQWQEVYG